MNRSTKNVLVLTFLVLAPALLADDAPIQPLRRPQGIYAVVNVEDEMKTNGLVESDFVQLYQNLLSNPAISGLAIWENWSRLNPNPPANPLQFLPAHLRLESAG
jgi:hypothetical protein